MYLHLDSPTNQSAPWPLHLSAPCLSTLRLFHRPSQEFFATRTWVRPPHQHDRTSQWCTRYLECKLHLAVFVMSTSPLSSAPGTATITFGTENPGMQLPTPYHGPWQTQFGGIHIIRYVGKISGTTISGLTPDAPPACFTCSLCGPYPCAYSCCHCITRTFPAAVSPICKVHFAVSGNFAFGAQTKHQ